MMLIVLVLVIFSCSSWRWGSGDSNGVTLPMRVHVHLPGLREWRIQMLLPTQFYTGKWWTALYRYGKSYYIILFSLFLWKWILVLCGWLNENLWNCFLYNVKHYCKLVWIMKHWKRIHFVKITEMNSSIS